LLFLINHLPHSAVTIAQPDAPLGTHVFTALEFTGPDHTILRWNNSGVKSCRTNNVSAALFVTSELLYS
jgi:hypothetical protein